MSSSAIQCTNRCSGYIASCGLASAGAQRLCRLGTANAHALGSPHDAMYPLQRFVHWMADDDITIARS